MENTKLRTDIHERLAGSRGAPPSLKIKIAELILDLLGSEHGNFGLFIILGWKNIWDPFADTPDISQDIFSGQTAHVAESINLFRKTLNYDGAILVDANGFILRSGVMIEVSPKPILKKLNSCPSSDLSEQFGFQTKVHMRHIAAIASSYAFLGTTVYAVSEETRSFHIFENGKIIYSTIPQEMTPWRPAFTALSPLNEES